MQTKQRKTAYNTGLAKVAVHCSSDTVVVNQSLFLRINIYGENRHLPQALNRCLLFSVLAESSEKRRLCVSFLQKLASNS